MKKIILVSAILIFIILIFNEEKYEYIPEESIRFRIIPNSNSIEDIFIKEKVLENVQKEIQLVGNYKDIKDSREAINNDLNSISNIVEETLVSNNYNLPYTINYGLNYFPEKKYNNIIYKEGYYESLVVSLGKGEGDNFWCVMFPPLCFMEVEESEEVEYKFKIIEIINKLFGL